ncbi:MAG TPA: DUF86 domain-containing protein [Candidatus Nanoarchaeia archaeon]|nr:DUF86 domain-containing protein [Candidatus Nanoarchaeia archaeon]
MKKDPLVFINHIKDSINLIEDFMEDVDQITFIENKLIQSAVIRQIKIIGEATKNIPNDFREQYPETPWKDIAGMRDKIIHHYFEVNLQQVWNVVKEDIPKLKRQIQKIMEKETKR